MPFSTASALATIALVASTISAAKTGRTYAIVRHSGNPIVEARMDPIISPGEQSGHTHSVFGGTGFAVSMDTDTALNANGTTAVINGDKSNYWFPKLFFEADNGTFFPVTVNQVNTYYFFEATDDDIKAFPPGLRILVGDPFKRSPPYTSASVLDAVNGQDTIQPLQFTCPRANSGPALYAPNSEGRAVDPGNAGAGIGFPSYTCDAEGTGIRFDVHFPSCYNPAVDVADYQNNMQYPSSANASAAGMQNCPEGWIHTPHLFLEAYFDQSPFEGMWEEGGATTPWRLAQGDPLGFGLHADFISGWNEADLQAMIDTCNAGFDGADKCPDLPSGVNTDMQVTIQDPFANELAPAPLEKLPGCNPIQNGPGEAQIYSGANCADTSSANETSSSSSPSASTSATSASSSITSGSASSTSASSPSSTSTGASSSPISATSAADLVAAEVSSTSSASSSTPTTSSDLSSDACEPDTTTNTTISLPPSWTSLGCYSDLPQPDLRVLTGINLANPGVAITPYTCASYCDTQGFSLAGTEYGAQCFCGNDLDASSKEVDAGECDMACTQNGGEGVCGGSKALSLTRKGVGSAKLRF